MMYLLDTMYCSRILNRTPNVIKRLNELGDTLIATCVIVQGELVFMARNSERCLENMQHVTDFLKSIEVYPVTQDVADIYGELKTSILRYFGPKSKEERRKTKPQKLGFSDNDLWIAAIAKYHGLTLVSEDSDFQRLQSISDLKVERW